MAVSNVYGGLVARGAAQADPGGGPQARSQEVQVGAMPIPTTFVSLGGLFVEWFSKSSVSNIA